MTKISKYATNELCSQVKKITYPPQTVNNRNSEHNMPSIMNNCKFST